MRTPTQEQQACIAAFEQIIGTTDKLLINAYAGAGKTSTLEMMARSVISSGVYLCFNKAIATESANRFPETVACKTTHSCAFREVVKSYSGNRNRDKMVGNLRVRDTEAALGIKDFPIFGGTDKLDKTTIAYSVNETVKRFRQSADREIEKKHFAKLPKFDTLPSDEYAYLKTCVVGLATQLWNRMADTKDEMPLGHDGYVKVWQLGSPIINAGYILMDESQDTNPVMMDVLSQQETPVIYVGDRHQQIYEWRGAVNAMQLIQARFSLNLTKSFRFGQAIADFASDILATIGETNRIQGNEAITSKLTNVSQKVTLCRTNGQILDSLLSYDEARKGISAHVVGGVDELVNCLEGVERLQSNRSSSFPMFMGFKDWNEFQEYTKKSGDLEAVKIVKLTDKYGVSNLKTVLRNVLPSPANADILLTTAHKSKGREWQGVELASDFREQPEVIDKDTKETAFNGPETRLFYVAATRAINDLKVPQWAIDIYKSNKEIPTTVDSSFTPITKQEAA